jgi:hypothetical protein
MTHRSPLIFWLLLTATLAVDVVILKLVADEPNPSQGYSGIALHALILGQLSIVCIWSACNATPNAWTRIAPLFAVLLAALTNGLSTRFTVGPVLIFYSGYFGMHAVLLLGSLWLLQRTNYWRRRTGSTRLWQFSLFHALIVMTVVAVLAAFMRNNGFLDNDAVWNSAFAISSVALAVISVILWGLSWHWLLRLASVYGVAALLAVGTLVIFVRPPRTGFDINIFNIFHTSYLIQAVVLSSWLGIGPILPLNQSATVEHKPQRAAAS